MKRRGIFVVLVFYGLSTFGPQFQRQAESEVTANAKVTVQLKRFTVRASNWPAFHREMDRRRRLDSGGNWRYALTKWKMIARDKIEISIYYPKVVSRSVSYGYRRRIEDIVSHENQHRRITEAVFRGCQRLNKTEIAEKIYQANAEFDHLTDHGRKLSTILPPSSGC